MTRDNPYQALRIWIPERRAPFVREQPAQMDLIPATPQRRSTTRENAAMYAAVVAIRKAGDGHTVYRRGIHHYVDGCHLTTKELLRMAKALR